MLSQSWNSDPLDQRYSYCVYSPPCRCTYQPGTHRYTRVLVAPRPPCVAPPLTSDGCTVHTILPRGTFRRDRQMPEAGRIASVAVNRANHSTLENSYHGKWKYFGNFVGNSQTAKSFLMREFLEHIFEIFFYKFLFDDLEIFVSFVFSFFFFVKVWEIRF